MFAGCSEISISVTVKHVQYIGVIRAFCLLGRNFNAWGGQKKNAGFCFATWINTQADPMVFHKLFFSVLFLLL